jgi:DNA-binding GntR family transcriptional regulator
MACHVDGVIEFEADVPRWKQVAAVIRQRIADGTYPPRTRVPSVIQLSAEFGIAQATAQKVHGGLRDEGLIYTEPGLGSFVVRQPPAEG